MPRILGKQVGGIGYGLMGLTSFRPTLPNDADAILAMRTAILSGCNFWNGGHFYGPPERNSLTLLRQYYEKYPEDADKVVLNIKGGAGDDLAPSSGTAFLRKNVEECLGWLGPRGKIDMFECSRRDFNVPLAETLKCLEALVNEGKIGGVALCEVNANTIREAAKITKIVAVEIELSLFCTEPLRNGIVEACAELGIPIIAYSPIGRGFLSGKFKSIEDIPEGNFMRLLPRYQAGNFENNVKLVNELEKISAKKNVTLPQLAIGWLRTLSKREDMPEIYPIPGAVSVERIKENAVEVELSEEEMKDIEMIVGTFKVVGDRWMAAAMAHADG